MVDRKTQKHEMILDDKKSFVRPGSDGIIDFSKTKTHYGGKMKKQTVRDLTIYCYTGCSSFMWSSDHNKAIPLTNFHIPASSEFAEMFNL